jgi:hypothetical protein
MHDLDHEVLAQLDRLERSLKIMEEKIVSALDDDRAAITDLTAEVTAALDALATQVEGGVSESDAEQLAADIRAQADRIRAAVPAPTEPPADGGEPTA